MSDYLKRQQRYMSDNLDIRLGGIAANLARVISFGKNPQNGKLVASLLRESAWFIEWSAPETSLDFALELANIQRQIVRWLADWSQLWSETILQNSGLLSRKT